MYTGTIIRKGSGKIMGTHQKIDRVARRKLQQYLPRVSLDDADLVIYQTSRKNLRRAMKTSFFPTSREIIKFEGLNGPDGIKKKSPGKDEPWHYINPDDPNDRQILDLIRSNENSLIQALRDNNREKAAFEAAWLAHGIVDGLTPAHHYPYKEKRDALLGEQSDEDATVLKKFLTSGENWREKLKNNYEFFKPNGQGVGSAHLYFELGVASTTAALRFGEVHLTSDDRDKIRAAKGITPLYMEIVQQIHALKMFDDFMANGWTTRLAHLTKDELMPTIIHTVLLSWYYCAWAARQDS